MRIFLLLAWSGFAIDRVGVLGMDAKSVLKKFKTPSFAAQVNREEVTDAISRIDASIEELISFIIEHQKAVS